MDRALRRIGTGLAAAFGVIALALGYWTLVRGQALLAREDNPRQVLAEQQVVRGQIVDRNGTALAETVVDPQTGFVDRRYVDASVAPVTGYYSLRYGVAGIESAYDGLLRGEALLTPAERLLRELTHRPTVGGDVQLTIDQGIQQAAAEALGDRRGAVVVVSVPDGEILALASAPTFDPNSLDADWDALAADPDAPLLNRATQGQYQPGTSLQSVLLGTAINTHVIDPEERWSGRGPVTFDGATLPCGWDGEDVASIGEAYQLACPAPFEAVAEELGIERLTGALSDFGLFETPDIELPTEAVDAETATADATLRELAIGQGDLTVSPLQMARVAAAFADNGQVPVLTLVRATRAAGSSIWMPVAQTDNPRGTVSPSSVATMAGLMRGAVTNGAADEAELPDHNVYGHAGLAVPGPDGGLNGWFIGYVNRTSEEAVAVAVLVEDVDGTGPAAAIGGAVLQAALEGTE